MCKSLSSSCCCWKLSASLLVQRLLVATLSGKEDLDLGPNDLHLDDFLLSGKFDLIAYADPELNLEEKKDMFNEELDLGEVAAEEKEGGARKAVKQEVQECTAVVQREGVCQSAASVGLSKVRRFQSDHHSLNASITNWSAPSPLKVEEPASGTAAVPMTHPQVNAAPLGMSSQVHPPAAGGRHSSLFRHKQRLSLTVTMEHILLFLLRSVRGPAKTIWLSFILPAVCVHLLYSGSPHVPSH